MSAHELTFIVQNAPQNRAEFDYILSHRCHKHTAARQLQWLCMLLQLGSAPTHVQDPMEDPVNHFPGAPTISAEVQWESK